MSGAEREELYPVTIIATRYGGAYEGGTWAAFHCDNGLIPSVAEGGDMECDEWWSKALEARWVGRGPTPNDALKDLEDRLQQQPPPDDMTRDALGLRYAP